MTENATLRPCNACASEIPKKARLCPVCKTWQRGWRNWLPYLGGVVTVVTLIASGATFIVNDFRKAPQPVASLAVLDVTNPGTINLLNTGNVDLLVTEIDFVCDQYGEMQSTHIESIVKHGEILSYKLQAPFKNGDDLELADTSQMAKFKDGIPKLTDGYYVQYFSQGHASVWLMRRMSSFKSVEATATLFYVPTSPAKDKINSPGGITIPLEAVLLRRKMSNSHK